DVFAAMRRGPVLVHHPYDSFHTSVERFLDQAAADRDVLAIKMTVYRTNADSTLLPALVRASEKGKQTVALVELKARF
ncbi:RNA degradosome polyphosphate kinase, partial [Klebsiella pneumoniae]|nr:RNA degradosome polyphosphate kinase [Klebsiella pneumoniae]